MVRLPDLTKAATWVRDLVVSQGGSPLSHQKSLNFTARIFGYKNWAHAKAAAEPTAQAAEPAAPQSSQPASTPTLAEALDWVARNYEATLGGKPVRDADECLLHARNLLSKQASASSSPIDFEPFTLFMETSVVGNEFASGPAWVELTVSPALVERLQTLNACASAHNLDSARVNWHFDNWDQNDEFSMECQHLTVGMGQWHVEGLPRHSDSSVESSPMSILALLKAIAWRQGGDEPTWTAFCWTGEAMLFSSGGNTRAFWELLADDEALNIPPPPLEE